MLCCIRDPSVGKVTCLQQMCLHRPSVLCGRALGVIWRATRTLSLCVGVSYCVSWCYPACAAHSTAERSIDQLNAPTHIGPLWGARRIIVSPPANHSQSSHTRERAPDFDAPYHTHPTKGTISSDTFVGCFNAASYTPHSSSGDTPPQLSVTPGVCLSAVWGRERERATAPAAGEPSGVGEVYAVSDGIFLAVGRGRRACARIPG